MSGFRGERGFGQRIKHALHERVRFQEVRAGNLNDFVKRVSAYPYYPPQPGDMLRAVFGPQAGIPETPRVPEFRVYARPTYHGFEFSATTDTGPRKISYRETDPHPPTLNETMARLRRHTKLHEEQESALRQAVERRDEVSRRQVPRFSEDFEGALDGRLRQGVDWLEASAAINLAFKAQGD
ncbi:MAG: hypothetical protein KGJ07_06205, partial [Patescibacteria group bacterium]|nr:hypothetical protein [Patescibacteria group bacterium]